MNKSSKWLFIGLSVLILFLVASVAYPEHKGVRALSKTTVLDNKQIDVNQIAAWMSNDGILCSDPVTGQSGLFYPKGGPADQAVIYTAGLWVVGKINNEIRSAAADYATEFQPGLILANGSPDDPGAAKYKIFKFKAEEWDSPAMAADRAEAIAQGMEDKMYGDQMLYCVYNDYASHSGVWTKPPIGLEVHMLTFGFNRLGALGNTIFIKYTFINKGTSVINDAYVSQFFDPDLGGAGDDGVGCDTLLGVGYVYNMDNYDDHYGASVPCFGCDFFQGPVVPAVGDTALVPGQPPLLDYKVLQMTSFGPYINGGPVGMGDPSLQSAQGAQMAYWFCSGLKGDGSNWLDPSQNNKITNWPFSGDPVKGTGWIQSLTWPGADMRMSMAAGPFQLEIGKPYDVVVGYVVGLGSNNLNSIEIMKSYDRSAQIAYNLNFKISKPAPYPAIAIGELDKAIALSWDNLAVNYVAVNNVDLDTAGNASYYNFEGYKLYQGESEGGPWYLIKQWDKDNDLTKLWDYVYDPISGENIFAVVENGKDSGLSFNFVVTKDYIKNIPLVNGKPYYFSLTTYSYNQWGSPRVLENAIKVMKIVPQKPLLNVALTSAPGDTLPVVHTGPSDGSVVALVINPKDVTGHEYKVTFYDAEGSMLWKVTDVTTGVDVALDQHRQAGAATLAVDEEFPVVDGFIVKVSGPPTGLKDEGYNYVPAANRCFTAWNDANAAAPLWHLEGWNGLFGWADNFFGTSVPATALKNVEIRFAACDELGNPLDPNDPNASMAYRYMRRAAAATADPTFEPFIINKTSGYPYQDMRLVCFSAYDMESTPPRRLNVGFNENNVVGGLVNGVWMPGRYDTQGGMNLTREFMFIFASDYSTTPQDLYTTNDMLNTVANVDLMYVGIPSRRGARLPQAGDKVVLSANHVNSSADAFTISTVGYDKKVGVEIAKQRLAEINVFPNPYFAVNKAETDFFTQFITFSNLPEECTIRIFSLSGQMVRSIKHSAKSPFETWDLTNEQHLPVASGMYIALVDVPGVGEKILKIAIINREARYQHM